MSKFFFFSRDMCKLLCAVIAWNIFGTVILAGSVNGAPFSKISGSFDVDHGFAFQASPQHTDSKLYNILFEEFFTDEENQEEENTFNLDWDFTRSYFSFSSIAEVAYFDLNLFHLQTFHTRSLYIRYCSLKIPFSIS